MVLMILITPLPGCAINLAMQYNNGGAYIETPFWPIEMLDSYQTPSHYRSKFVVQKLNVSIVTTPILYSTGIEDAL